MYAMISPGPPPRIKIFNDVEKLFFLWGGGGGLGGLFFVSLVKIFFDERALY